MIQRIQTVYLLAVFFLSGMSTLLIWRYEEAPIMLENRILVLSSHLISAALALFTIFNYKKRKQQFVINRLNILLNLILLGFFAYRSLKLSGETMVSEKGIGMLIPVFSIVFLVFANRAIKKDEDLVKSVDRLR